MGVLESIISLFEHKAHPVDAIMGRLSNSLLGLDDRRLIMRGIAKSLVEHLGLKSAHLFTLSEDTKRFVLFETDGEISIDALPLSHPFFDYFKQPIAPTLLHKLPYSIHHSLKDYSFFSDSLIYPIHSFGKLQGVFILGPKKSGKPLSVHDHVLLFSVIHLLLILFDRIAYDDHLTTLQTALDDATKAASVFWLVNDYMHDLKTPWGLLLSATDPRSGCVTTDDFRARISKYSERAFKTLSLINRILARGRERITVPIELTAAITDILSAHSDMSVVSFTASQQSCFILGDPSDITILIINLLKNAKEATDPLSVQKNQVALHLEVDSDTCTIHVSDTGCGMSPEAVEAILSGVATSSKCFGSGVGTRAVLRIIHDHKASLFIESTEDEGSVFSVTFTRHHNF